MIIGRGLLANALVNIDSDRFIFYVNGISNSVSEFIPDDNVEIKEIEKIAKEPAGKTLVYFSTIQVKNKANHSRPYVRHKFFVENLIEKQFSKFLIVRTSNLVGNNLWNKHTLFNYLFNALQNELAISIKKSATRNVLDVEHFIIMLDNYLQSATAKNCIIDIGTPKSYTMDDIAIVFETYFHKKFKTNTADISVAQFDPLYDLSISLAKRSNIPLDNYLVMLLQKYYS